MVYYTSLLVVEVMLFPVCLYWRLKILMNCLRLQHFDCHSMQMYL